MLCLCLQSDKKKQNPLATGNVRATYVHSKTKEECCKREFHFNLRNTNKNLLVHFSQ